MFISKRVEGRVEYNNGEFAEVATIGVEGIEKGLWLDSIQISSCDTEETAEQFRDRFPVGARLCIQTTTEITRKFERTETVLET
jgi:hypothetical protein